MSGYALVKDKWAIEDGMERKNRGRKSKYLTLDDWDEFIDLVQIGDCIEISRKGYNHWCVFVGPHYYYQKYGNTWAHQWNSKKVQQVVHINGNSPLGSASYVPSSTNKSNKTNLELFVEVVTDSKFRINNCYDLDKPSRPIEDILIVIDNELNGISSKYNLFLFNCEHFVKYIRNNEKRCEQLDAVLSTGKTILTTCLSAVPFVNSFIKKVPLKK